MTEREVESREPLEWTEVSPEVWVADDQFWMVKRRDMSPRWSLYCEEACLGAEKTIDEAKDLAQRLADVLDGVPDQTRAEQEFIKCEHCGFGIDMSVMAHCTECEPLVIIERLQQDRDRIRAEALAEVVAKLTDMRDHLKSHQIGPQIALGDAIAAVRELGEKP